MASVLVLVGVWAVSPVGATTYHVSPQGLKFPPYGSYATAAHGVADAFLASSGPGDTVVLHVGEYNVGTTIAPLYVSGGSPP